jgi:peptidoglycan-associated lipoprotein
MMKRWMVLMALCCVCALWAGCNKKTTKVEQEPAAPAAEAPEEAEPPAAEPMPLSDEAVFESLDMDAEMQEVFQMIHFDFDQYDLRPDAVERLQVIGAYLVEHPSVRVLAEGHCDEPGSAEYNVGLGERRANAARDYLVAYGVNKNRLEVTSYGKERPLDPNCTTPECHARNRRVEWKILAK